MMNDTLSYTLIFLPASEQPTRDMDALPVLVLTPERHWYQAFIRALTAVSTAPQAAIFLPSGQRLQPATDYVAWSLLPATGEIKTDIASRFSVDKIPSREGHEKKVVSPGVCINSIVKLRACCGQ